MIRSAFATLGVLLLSLAAYASPTGLGYATDYNVFTLGNLGNGSSGGIHIVGRVAVGGNVTKSISVGPESGEWSARVSTPFYTYIAGTNGNVNVNQDGVGDAYVGREGSARVNVNAAGHRLYDASKETVSAAVLINFDQARTDLTLLSQGIASLKPTSTGEWVDDGRRYALTATSDAVFNLTESEFAKLAYITTGNYSVIINVIGDGGEEGIVYETGNNLSVDGERDVTKVKTGNVLFNFKDADKITLNNPLLGTILAPKATLTTDQNLKGQIIVNNLANSGEIHASKYTGTLPTPTPEPSTLVLLGSGLVGLWKMRGKLRH